MSNKKILFIVQLPPPVHGVSVMNHHAVHNPLFVDRYQIKVLPLHFGQKLDDIGTISSRKLLHMAGFIVKLFFTMLAYRPHLVYFTIMPTGKVFYRDAFLTKIIKWFNPKIIFHLHGKGIKEAADQSPFLKRLYQKTFNSVYVICLSHRLTKDLEGIYYSQPYILPNGIEIQNQKICKVTNKIPIIIYLSNLSINKGVQVFINSLIELQKEDIMFSALIVGDSMDYSIEETKTFIEEKGLADKVSVIGPKFGEEKMELLSKADIFVLPSFNECFPLTILEAMQVGLPVVATKTGGIPDIISNNKEGILVEINDTKGLSEKLKELLMNATLRNRLGCNGKEKFNSHYTIDQFNLGLAKIIENVITLKRNNSKL